MHIFAILLYAWLPLSLASTPHVSGIDETIIDRSAQPCEDFYQFACGKWLLKAEIPADLPAWDRSFTALSEQNKIILRKILEGYVSGSKTPKNPYSAKLGDFYAACMDEEGIEKNSLNDLQEAYQHINALTSGKDFAPLIAQLHLNEVGVLFDTSDEQDFKDSTQVIAAVDQGGLGLPDRDYYLKDDAKMVEIRNLYEKHIAKMFELMGTPVAQSAAEAKTILKMETELAKVSMSRVDRRNPFNVYHRLERDGLKQIAPMIDWDQYFKVLGIPKTKAINVAVPEFFKGLSDIVNRTPIEDMRTYLRWHLMHASVQGLPKRFVDEDFAFTSHALSGQKELPPRWKRCVRLTDRQLGFALGRSFVEQVYGSEGKSLTQEMIQKVESAMESDLKTLAWMDDPTRKEALRKMKKLYNKVGYPDKWRKYDSLTVNRKSFLKSLLNASEFDAHYHLNKIGKPLDRSDWDMSPPTVNAYYDPSMNEMVFPAGILQPPFFDKGADQGANFGAIGMVMGHELTHGFDDEGRHYNADGNLIDWWSPEVGKEFDARAECVAKEYDAFEPLPNLHINGHLTLGENIADHGGLKLGYEAWRGSAKKSAEAEAPDQAGFTPDQRFFLAFAQSWCAKRREPYARMLLTTDPHSPPQFRVNGTVSQDPVFIQAFQCKAGSKMAPKTRCEIW